MGHALQNFPMTKLKELFTMHLIKFFKKDSTRLPIIVFNSIIKHDRSMLAIRIL